MGRTPWPALAAIGRHSLKVFCAGLFLSFAGTWTLTFSARPWLEPPLLLSGIALLAVFAHWLDGPSRAQAILSQAGPTEPRAAKGLAS